MLSRSKLLFCALITFFVAASLPATSDELDDLDSTRLPLKGVRDLKVLVTGVPECLNRIGISKSQTTTDVELRLRSAGVNVNESSRYTLLVTVSWVQGDLKVSAAAVRTELIQPAILIIGSNPLNYPNYRVSTWCTDGTFLLGEYHYGNIRTAIDNQVSQFLNDYLAANPRQQ